MYLEGGVSLCCFRGASSGRGGGRGVGGRWGQEDVPVHAALPGGIVEAVEHVQEHGAEVSLIRPVARGGEVVTGEAGLPLVASAPDGEGEDEEDDEGGLGAGCALEALDVEGVAEDDGTDHLGEPVEEGVEGAGADVEEGAVDGVGLVGGEPVRGPEHGEEEEDVGLGDDGLVEADELGAPRGVLHEDDARAVGADHVVCVAEEQGQDGTGEHEHDEGDVSSILDPNALRVVDVQAQWNQGPDDTAQVEDGPEPGEGAALLGLERVGHHDGALGGPEETGADTEQGAREVAEPIELSTRVMRGEQRDGVDAVADATERKGCLDTQTVDEGAGEETHDGEGAVEGNVLRMWLAKSCFRFPHPLSHIPAFPAPMESLAIATTRPSRKVKNYHIRSQCMIVASTTTQTRQCVEHTGAREADERDHQELEHRRRVPRHDHRANLALAVHPS